MNVCMLSIIMYVHIYSHINTYMHTYIYTHTHIRAYIHTYIYTYIYTYIHTYMHTLQKCLMKYYYCIASLMLNIAPMNFMRSSYMVHEIIIYGLGIEMNMINACLQNKLLRLYSFSPVCTDMEYVLLL